LTYDLNGEHSGYIEAYKRHPHRTTTV